MRSSLNVHGRVISELNPVDWNRYEPVEPIELGIGHVTLLWFFMAMIGMAMTTGVLSMINDSQIQDT